jgi:hypothetical protein
MTNLLQNPENPVLVRLRENIFLYPFSSVAKDEGGIRAKQREKSKALKYAYIQINGPRKISYLCFDIDRRFAGIAWIEANLPMPTIIVINPDGEHTYLIYELKEPIWKSIEHNPLLPEAPPIRYMDAIYNAMHKALDADPDYNKLLVQNPFHPRWTVRIGRNEPYTLAELAEHLDLSDTAKAISTRGGEGRNCSLFDSVREWSYRHVNELKSYDDFTKAIYYETKRLNNEFSEPLPLQEVRSITRSISRWTWSKYDGNYEPMGNRYKNDEKQLANAKGIVKERKQVNQLLGAKSKVDKTMSKIEISLSKLLEENREITVHTVSLYSKISERTVYRYWTKIESRVAGVASSADGLGLPYGEGIPDRECQGG